MSQLYNQRYCIIHNSEGNVISKVRTIFVSRYAHPANVMFQPFWKRRPLLFGWTASNDRRENVWMLVSSLCIPPFYKYNLAWRSTGNINWWKSTCLSYHSHSISCFCWITHHHGDSVRLLYPIIKSERVHLHFHVSCCLGI